MRKIFPIIAVLVILISCAVPTFAIGTQTASDVQFSALPFDFLSVTGSSSPWFTYYPFASCGVTSSNSSVDYHYFSQDIGVVRSDGTSQTSNVFTGYVYNINGLQTSGRVEYSYIGQGNAGWQTLTLSGYDMTIDVNNVNEFHEGPHFTLVGDPLNGFYPKFVKVRVYGSYYVPYWVDDMVRYTPVEFDTTFSLSDARADVYWYVYRALHDTDHYTPIMTLSELNVDLVYNDGGGIEKTVLTYGEQTSHTYNDSELTFSDYQPYAVPIGDPPGGDVIVETEFELGTFLSKTIGGFMSMEIFGGISFGALLGAILGVVFVLWFIKVIK